MSVCVYVEARLDEFVFTRTQDPNVSNNVNVSGDIFYYFNVFIFKGFCFLSTIM